MTVDELRSLLNNVVMGGFLHDVGKLVQRATKKRVNHMEGGPNGLKSWGSLGKAIHGRQGITTQTQERASGSRT
ncbi:MAG: hypothetical protein GX108_03860 [Thermovirga sp.]|nr:hypothetical protein [Thermovirga sp.]